MWGWRSACWEVGARSCVLLEIKINESNQDKNPWWEYEGHDHVANNSWTTVEHSTVCSTDLKVSRCEDLSGKYLARDPLKCTCGQSTVNGTSREHCVGHTVLSGQRNRTAPCSRSWEWQGYSERLPQLCIPKVPCPGLCHLHLSITHLAASVMRAKVSPSRCSRLSGWDFWSGSPCWAGKLYFT